MTPITVRIWLVPLAILFTSSVWGAGDEPRPLVNAHSHNDYHHARPLLDALDNGFCNVEADVFLVDQHLLVGHSRDELHADRTLEKLYLDPLRERIQRNQGRVFRNGPEFVLLVDIKSEGASTFAAVHSTLTRYSELLTRYDGDQIHPGALRVIISGNRPREAIEHARPQYAGMDGRIADLSALPSAAIMPLISDNFGLHFQWRGDGPLPPDEKARLRDWVRQAHLAQRRIRFWNTPESETVWTELAAAGVDLVNTDDLPRLRQFFESSP